MALPKIDLPVYELTIPSTGKVVKVRPFTVKEEKLLLMALESKVASDIITTVKQVINNCLVSGEIDVEKLPFFDVDYIFIFLRAKSVGESVTVNLTCHNVLKDGNECGNRFPSEMDIAKTETINKETNADIRLNATSGVKMRYPNYGIMRKIESLPEMEQRTEIIIASIDYIYDKKGMYSYKDYTKEELKEFVEGLTEENYNKLIEWIDNFPTVATVMEATCDKCGFEHKVRYTEFFDFFM
jgi:hypothetical protein